MIYFKHQISKYDYYIINVFIDNHIIYVSMKLNLPMQKMNQLAVLTKKPISISPDVYLTTSILLETLCTTGLSNVNKNPLLFIPIYTGYGISFYLFPKCLDKYSLSTAYTLWSGFGILFTFIFDLVLKKEILKLKKIIGTMFVIYGIYMIT